ncbi:hypothetical protein [Streptomyces sp.]|uniref:HNH endonuclease n=1 Tax=Streptomyces sp. TaxID=1931 RepID=UPI002D7954D3|nr:hypothetical protein [Streptomyces sp.]HET6352893.1 hypothetical protein [Streptomyces sp.]
MQTASAALGHRHLVAQDTIRAPHVLRSQRPPQRRQEATGRAIWTNLTDAPEGSGPHGPSSDQFPPRKRADHPALEGKCELCGTSDDVRVHHIRRLADLDREEPPTEWRRVMAKKRRKTLVVCTACPHDAIHSGKPT